MDSPRPIVNQTINTSQPDDGQVGAWEAFVAILGICASLVCIMVTIKLGFILFG